MCNVQKWCLGDLAATVETAGGRTAPASIAFTAGACLFTTPFLIGSTRERARRVHTGSTCRASCSICLLLAARYAHHLTSTIQRRLSEGAGGPDDPGAGQWSIIREWLTSASLRLTEVDAVRAALAEPARTGSAPLDPGLRLLADTMSQLLLFGSGATRPRRIREALSGVAALRADNVGWLRDDIMNQQAGQQHLTLPICYCGCR